MKSSTANFIFYNLRPAKQAERRILLDFLKCANGVDVPFSQFRYVGMGGNTFYDFRIFHRFLGISNMISLERDPKMHPRSHFNCPFDFITVKNQAVSTFLAADAADAATIYWFDYDDSIGPDIIADILSLGTKVRVGGFAFVTVCAQPPGSLQLPQERLDYFQQEMEEFAVGLTLADMDNSVFTGTIHHILLAAFKKAFAAHPNGVFRPLFQVFYKDSIQMVTVGGVCCAQSNELSITRRVKADLPFLFRKKPYKIEAFNLTEREKFLFDIAVTHQTPPSNQEERLRELGFRQRDFDAYRDLIRFLPRYHESII